MAMKLSKRPSADKTSYASKATESRVVSIDYFTCPSLTQTAHVLGVPENINQTGFIEQIYIINTVYNRGVWKIFTFDQPFWDRTKGPFKGLTKETETRVIEQISNRTTQTPNTCSNIPVHSEMQISP